MLSCMPLAKIVSGGQTGVDRAALDAALDLAFPCGGWCPKGRRAEDGPIAARYPLRETSSTEYPARTERNVRDSDGTLVLAREPLRGGTALTERLARRHGRPFLVLDPGAAGSLSRALAWIEGRGIAVLNVAGPRESEAPGFHAKVFQLVKGLIESALSA
jgi:hypothetical protein